MPPRSVCLAILLYWVVAASSLIRRDILPEMGFVRPPDLRTIARAEENAEPSRWSVEVIDNPLSPENRRAVGEASTRLRRSADGWVSMSSKVSFDSGGLLKGTPFSRNADGRLEIVSEYRVDPSGNLQSFRATVRSAELAEDLLTVEGTLKKRSLEVVTRGQLPMLNQTRTLPYEPRSLVQNAMGPFDRLPGLQVGQRWETRVVSPLTGRIETVRVEVPRRSVIHWDKNPVSTLEVVHHMTPFSARTWVRPDGLVLRQEVPFPFVKLVLERLADRTTALNLEDPGPMIELRSVTKTFGSKKAVDQLDLDVRAGELFAFLGPNGAGKTTTIKMVCGLLSPTAGTVRVGGHPAASQEARQLLAYVPDQPYLYEKLTGREFLRFVVEMYGLDRRKAEARLAELIETFEMEDYVDDLCENYSQGMKQRVVFASALVHDPRVLIVDEPLVGLDPRSARIVKDLFISQARAGVAVLMSTHLLSIAEELADTIGIVDHGRMLARGTLAELRERLQSHGPLEDLFLKLTGGTRPLANGRIMVPQPGPAA